MKVNLYHCEECGVAYIYEKFAHPPDAYDSNGEFTNATRTRCRVCNAVAVVFLVYVDL